MKPLQIIRGLSVTPPSAAWLDHYLFSIAKAHGVKWMPDLQPHEKSVTPLEQNIFTQLIFSKLRVNAISEMLDPNSVPEIDMTRLRSLCAHGTICPWVTRNLI